MRGLRGLGSRIGIGISLAFAITVTGVGLLAADTNSDSRPIHLGVSGGSDNDRKQTTTQIVCCGGTLGALVSRGGTQYILSNNHVLARSNNGLVGDPIIQPGLIDEAPVCGQDTGDTVANLSEFIPVKFLSPSNRPTNFVDAAIAEVVPGKVRSDGAQVSIGPISTTIVADPAIGLAVQKDGRTTNHTTGTIQSTNVTVRVRYSRACGGGGGRAKFKQQLLINPGTFSAAGDSGSLIVDTSTPPQAVGLLFAGSSTATIANMIGNVLNAPWSGGPLGMVGSTAAQAPFMRWLAAVFPRPRAADAAIRGGLKAASVLAALRAQDRHEDGLLEVAGVAGLGIAASDVARGEALIEIYVERHSATVRAALPAQLDGVAVRLVETGEFLAY